ncbi:MAG TPA: hypothetical protein PKW15_03085 [Alphaproteobacteria bacterium]|nr:hypothetical protein [Rhodospirillaceae bacterium]HRJ12209.1 hypothetical protein [Alphaproteobacteria bacterium]
MANLIITIISIALVGVAALMGAYYAGEAFYSGQAKAKANSIVNAANQIEGAIRIWASTNMKGNTDYPDWNSVTGASSELISGYLTQMPQPFEDKKFELLMVDSGGDMTPLTDNGTTNGPIPASGYFMGLYMQLEPSPAVTGMPLCQEINRISVGSPTVPTTVDFMGSSATPSILSGARFVCINDAASGKDYFIYRIN